MNSSITPRELEELRHAGSPVNLLDVRTPAEYAAVHAQGARNMPLDRLDIQALLAGHAPGQPLYVICQADARARQACGKIVAAGCNNVFTVEGGTQAWLAAGLPVVRGPTAISLERQVRIAAGSFVLLGIALGVELNPWCLSLSAVIAAGLVYSGITDTCGMALLLARMPWNRTAASTQ